jgi:hypothetical protein
MYLKSYCKVIPGTAAFQPSAVIQIPFMYIWVYSTFFNDAELVQNRKPDGSGPSGNTWPRSASQTLHNVSIRVMPYDVSFLYRITFSFRRAVKLGQPVLESNFVVLSNRCVPQQTQPYTPGAK